MKKFQFHESYSPATCPPASGHMAATVGAGIQDGELFDLLAKHNAIGVGGTNTVRQQKPTWLNNHVNKGDRTLVLSAGLPVEDMALLLGNMEWALTTLLRQYLSHPAGSY